MPRDASPAFIGRQAELDRLDAAWQRAVQGEPQLLLIGGDAGIGKTRLLREYLAQPVEGRVTAVGGCVPVAGGSLPYTPFTELLRTLASPIDARYDPAVALDALAPVSLAELSRLVPTLRSPTAAPVQTSPESDESFARARLFEAVLSYLLGIAAQVPTLLVIEDLHWADGSSRDLLSYLVRNLRTHRLLILATYRTDELHRRHPLRAWAAEIGRLDVTERLDLRPLDADDIRRDIAELLGSDADPSLVERIVMRAEGNPLFAIELVASARHGTEPRALPETLRDGFLDRLERLEPDARQIVRHVALVGRPASERLVQDSTGLAADRLATAIHEALDAQVLVSVRHKTEDRFEPRHALLGEAIVDDLLPGERTALHRRIADLLEAETDDDDEPARIAGEVAHHRWAAHQTELAVAASVRAAVAASDALAHAEADAHWTRALEAWPPEGEVEGFDHPAALLRASEVAWAVGDLRRAGDLATQALERIDPQTDPLRAARAHRALHWYLALIDRRANAVHIAQAARLIQTTDEPTEAAKILAERAWNLSARLILERAEPIARRALELAVRYQAHDAEAQALAALGFCLHERSAHAEAIELLTRGFELAEQLDEARLAAVGLLVTVGDSLCVTLNDVGRWQEALAHADRVQTRFGELGLAREYTSLVTDYRTWALLSLGRWREADTSLAADAAEVAEDRYHVVAAALAILRARQGRVEETAKLVTSAARDENSVGRGEMIRVAGSHLHARAEVALAQGEWTELREAVGHAFALIPANIRDAYPDLRPYVMLGLQAEAELAFEARIRRDAEAEAEALRIARDLAAWMRTLARRVTEAGEPLAGTTLADAALAEALLTRVEHRPDPDAWRTALERSESLGNPYDIARIRRWLAEAILDSGGSRAEATAELTPALATAVELGAAGLERDIRDLARRARLELGTGHGAAAPDGRDQPSTSADASAAPQPTGLVEPLTAREREVLGYLAAGWTNRRIGEALFISDKTVSVHVSNLLGKLGAANRAEAALIGDRLGLLELDPGRT